MSWTIRKEINLSQIITIAVLLLTFSAGYVRLLTQVEDNSEDISELKTETKTISKDQDMLGDQLHDIKECQKRQLKYTELIADKLNITYVE